MSRDGYRRAKPAGTDSRKDAAAGSAHEPRRNRPRPLGRMLALMLTYSVCGSLGDVLLRYGLRHHPVEVRWVAAAMPLFAIGYGIFLGLLRNVPLSVVVPAQSSSYILTVTLSYLVLREEVPWLRWAGTLLVSLGVGIVLVSERQETDGVPG